MIKVVLFALALSTAIILALLAVAYFHQITIVYRDDSNGLVFREDPKIIGETDDKICYIHIYDIAQRGSSQILPTQYPELYRLNINSINISISYDIWIGINASIKSASTNRTVLTAGTLLLNSIKDASVRVFEVNKSSSIELERIIREELRRSQYSDYIPLVVGEGYRRVIDYVEQVAIKEMMCSPSRLFTGMISNLTVYRFQWLCPTSDLPHIGNVHVVEMCLNRGALISILLGGFMRIDKVIDLVANATRYNLSGDAIKAIVYSLTLPFVLDSIMAMNYNIVLSPQAVHIWRALAFLLAFVSGIFLHYRLRPEEYSGFIRFFRRLRRRIGG
ncbi:MAG: hypothetical protein QW348_02530 [Ignisphaera sp.]